MFSSVIRTVTPSLRQQPRLCIAAAAHTQAAAAATTAAAQAQAPGPAPSKLDEGEKAIYDKLSERFQTSELLVQDVSGGCGAFYAITIASEAFKGIPVVKQHRLVNEALKEEIEGIHGLQLKTVPL